MLLETLGKSAVLATLAGTLCVTLAMPAGKARADDDEYYPPVTNELVKAECGACHMTFQPAMMPARSWKAMMADLGNHFGEDASLDDATRNQITEYLVAKAAPDRSRIARSVSNGEAVIRISDMPWWIKEHRGEVSPNAFDRPEVGSKANCIACHKGAGRGYYEDD